MNSPWLRQTLLGLSFLVCFGSQKLALGNHGLVATVYSPVAETVYGVPSSYVVPTSYIYPTAAYLYPTSYVYPTAYTTSSYVLSPTSYVVPTYYRATSYLVPRRYVARPVYSTALTYYPTTTYSPTAYYTAPTVVSTSYVPTVVDTPVVTSSTVCCAEAPPIPSTTAPAQPPRSSSSGNDERAPSSTVESMPSNVPPYRPEEGANAGASNESRTPPEPTPLPPAQPQGTPPEPNPPPPAAPAPDRETNSAPIPPVQSQTPAPGPTRYQARKPVAPSIGRPESRAANVLEGKVVSSETRRGEEGVRVILSNRTGNFVDRVQSTDAFGRYAVRLPDGDWTVKVAMPSGRVYEVSQITISGGQIIDNLGRDVPSLTITR